MIKRALVVSGFGCLIGTVLGLCYAVHIHAVGEEDKPILWSAALTDYLGFWVGWGLLSGPIAVMVHRFPISRHRKRNAIYLLAATTVTSPLHAAFCFAALALGIHFLGVKLPYQHMMS